MHLKLKVISIEPYGFICEAASLSHLNNYSKDFNEITSYLFLNTRLKTK